MISNIHDKKQLEAIVKQWANTDKPIDEKMALIAGSAAAYLLTKQGYDEGDIPIALWEATSLAIHDILEIWFFMVREMRP